MRNNHEIISNDYPLYEGANTQEAMKAWKEAIEEQLDVTWYVNGILYRTSQKPSQVAV
jgi:hypothetical protein